MMSMISLFEYNEKEIAATDDAPAISTVNEFYGETSILDFTEPTSVATDPNGGYFYVVDEGVETTGIVQEIDDTSGIVRDEWGSQCYATAYCLYRDPVTGESKFKPGKLVDPIAIAVDLQRNVYIVDEQKGSVQKFNSTGDFIRESTSDNRTNGRAFVHVQGVAIDKDGNLYVADSGNYRIVKFDPSGGYLTAWGSQGTRDGQFGSIDGIAVDLHLGLVYVSDGLNGRIQVFDTNGIRQRNLVLTSLSESEYFYPTGLSVAQANGDLYVIDTGMKDKLQDNPATLQKFSGPNGNVTQHLYLQGPIPKSIAVNPSDEYLFVVAGGNVFLIEGMGT